MRKAMDMDLVQGLVTKMQATYYTPVDIDFCKTLISNAANSNLS